MFYPEAVDASCTAALLLEVDPVGLVRGRKGAGGRIRLRTVRQRSPVCRLLIPERCDFARPGSGARRTKHNRQDLAHPPIPSPRGSAPCHAAAAKDCSARLFEPLGHSVSATSHELDEQFPDWATALTSPWNSRTLRLGDLLTHLYVLIPVLDNDKHYWIGEDEVEKLLRHGEGGWRSIREGSDRRPIPQASPPPHAQTLARLVGGGPAEPDEAALSHGKEEEPEKRISLNE